MLNAFSFNEWIAHMSSLASFLKLDRLSTRMEAFFNNGKCSVLQSPFIQCSSSRIQWSSSFSFFLENFWPKQIEFSDAANLVTCHIFCGKHPHIKHHSYKAQTMRTMQDTKQKQMIWDFVKLTNQITWTRCISVLRQPDCWYLQVQIYKLTSCMCESTIQKIASIVNMTNMLKHNNHHALSLGFKNMWRESFALFNKR